MSTKALSLLDPRQNETPEAGSLRIFLYSMASRCVCGKQSNNKKKKRNNEKNESKLMVQKRLEKKKQKKNREKETPRRKNV